MLNMVYLEHESENLINAQELGIKIAAPVGNLIGQVTFGWLADVLGR